MFGGIREGFPEEGTLGQALKNHIQVWLGDDGGRECQVEGTAVLLKRYGEKLRMAGA